MNLKTFQTFANDWKDRHQKHFVKRGLFQQTPSITLNDFSTVRFCFLFDCFLFSPFVLAYSLHSLYSVSVVLTAAVTQASLQSMLHKILTAGPSAFNITTLLSQATQLSNQGTHTHTHCAASTSYSQTCYVFICATMQSKLNFFDTCGFRVSSVLWPDLELYNLSSWFRLVVGVRLLCLCCRFMSAVGFWVSFLELADGVGSLTRITHTGLASAVWADNGDPRGLQKWFLVLTQVALCMDLSCSSCYLAMSKLHVEYRLCV